MTLSGVKLPNCNLAAFAFWIGFALTTTGCSNDSTIQEVKEFHHDFRGKPLPAEFGLFQVNDDKLVQIEPEGLRIRMLRPFTSPGYGIGVRTNFGFKGDFDVTVAFELLQMDMPPASPKAGPASIGVTLFLVPVHGGINAATAMDRFIQVDDIRLVKANNRGRPLSVSSTLGLANSPIGQGPLFGAFGLILGKTRDTNGIRWWAKDPLNMSIKPCPVITSCADCAWHETEASCSICGHRGHKAITSRELVNPSGASKRWSMSG